MQINSITQSIHTDSGALCFWSWNDTLEKEELRRQLEDFSKERFSGVLVHARGGLRIPYMGEEWFDCYRFVVKEAKRLGLEVWIYDEDGWPSGFAGGEVTALGEKHWLKELHFSESEIGLPENRVAAWRKTEEGYQPITKDSAKKGDLICWYTTDKNYVDLLSSQTVKCFIDKTHERYKEELGDDFGGVIKGVFTDEPQIRPYPWSVTIEEAWLSRYHEPLTNKLYLLVKEETGFESFRWKFRDLVSDLFYNSFTKQIADWCEQNGLIFTGHFSEEDGLAMQVHSNCGVTRHYTAMQMPGIDHLGNRNTSPILLKQPSSVVNQLGKPDVLSETYGCAGWDISFKQICSIWGRQSVLGITKPCFHLSAYSIAGRRKRDYPAFYSYQEPWWEQFPTVMKWINGLNSLMREGERISDVLVISPLGGVSASYGTEIAQKISCDYRSLVENLLNAQVDVELGDEKVISEFGRAESGMFFVGRAAYRIVVVPKTLSLTQKTVMLLNEFSRQGGQIWYCGDSERNEEFKLSKMPKGVVVRNRGSLLEKHIAYSGYQRPITLYSEESCELLHGVLIHTRRIDGKYRSHIWAGSELRGQRVKICLDAPDGENIVNCIDIASKKCTPLSFVRDGDKLVLFLDLLPDSSVVLEWSKSEATIEPSEQYEFCREYTVNDYTVRLDSDNALTLDYAQISVNGEAYTEKRPVVRMLKFLYEEREKFPSELPMPVKLKYHFECSEELELKGIKAVIENEFVLKIEVNGIELLDKAENWWIDRKFGEYDIGDYLQAGDNTVILYYELPPSPKGTRADGFESERNRFFFPVEPDSIYIKGDFDVLTTAETVDKGNCYRVRGDEFLLSPSTKRRFGDITKQNSWFYRGDVNYTFCLTCNKDIRYRLLLVDAKGIGAEITVGDKIYIALSLKEVIDITELLTVGENLITVKLLGHNRNLLGPHHHIKGETGMVGPDTFEGQLGFEDFVSPEIKTENTWTDAYHFVPFGCGGIRIREEKPKR